MNGRCPSPCWVGRDTAAEQIPQEGLGRVCRGNRQGCKDLASRLDLPARGTQPGHHSGDVSNSVQSLAACARLLQRPGRSLERVFQVYPLLCLHPTPQLCFSLLQTLAASPDRLRAAMECCILQITLHSFICGFHVYFTWERLIKDMGVNLPGS